MSHPANLSRHFASVSCSQPGAVFCRWFNLFTSTCSHCCVCCSLVVIFKLPLTWLFIVYFVWSASLKLHLCFFLVSFLFLFYFFIFLVFPSKTPLRHSHTCTASTSPRSTAETETIQERCVLLQIAAPHLPPFFFSLVFWFASLSVSFSLAFALSVAAFHSAQSGGFVGQLQ